MYRPSLITNTGFEIICTKANMRDKIWNHVFITTYCDRLCYDTYDVFDFLDLSINYI